MGLCVHDQSNLGEPLSLKILQAHAAARSPFGTRSHTLPWPNRRADRRKILFATIAAGTQGSHFE